MTVEHRSVVIVGTGPAGMTAASLLGRYDVDTLVVDRWADVFPQPRAVHLDDETHRILGDLGLTEAFAAISRPGHGLRLVDKDMSTIAEFPRDPGVKPNGFPPANMFDQPELEHILRDKMTSHKTVEFRGGIEITETANMRDHVRIKYVDIDSGESRCITADYVLGCDGANSTVRSSIGSTMTELGFAQRWLVIDVSTAADLQQWDGVHQLCDVDRAGTYMRIGTERYRWEFRLRDDESADDFTELDQVRPLIAPWLGTAHTPDLKLIRSIEYTFRAQVANRWRDRRIFLLGDAAHLTPPFIGQGMGAGLRDAKNLVWKLVGVMNGVLPESALDTYEQERKPHATAMIKLAITIGLAMTGGGQVAEHARKLLAPLFVRMPGVSARVNDSTTPRLHTSDYVRRNRLSIHDLAGSLCPNAPLDGGNRLDDVAPDQFLFVTAVIPSAAQQREIVRRGAVVVQVPLASDLGSWLTKGRALAAIVRPDRTVLAAGRSLPALHTLLPASVAPVSM